MPSAPTPVAASTPTVGTLESASTCSRIPFSCAASSGTRASGTASRASSAMRRTSSCVTDTSVPLPFETRVGDDEPLASDVLVVEVHRHLRVAPDAAQLGDRARTEPLVPDALSLDVARRILGELDLDVG